MLNPVKSRKVVENVKYDHLYIDIPPGSSGHASVIYYADKELSAPMGEYPAGFFVPVLEQHDEAGVHISSAVLLQIYGFTSNHSKTHNIRVWVSAKNLKRSHNE